MNEREILETLQTANELIAKQQEEITRLRLALALMKYQPPRRETRGRKSVISKEVIDCLVKIEPTMKDHFFMTGERYARINWVYIVLRLSGLASSDHRAKSLQPRAIKNMIEALKKIPK